MERWKERPDLLELSSELHKHAVTNSQAAITATIIKIVMIIIMIKYPGFKWPESSNLTSNTWGTFAFICRIWKVFF